MVTWPLQGLEGTAQAVDVSGHKCTGIPGNDRQGVGVPEASPAPLLRQRQQTAAAEPPLQGGQDARPRALPLPMGSPQPPPCCWCSTVRDGRG